ncbi:MAG: hypothetical protein EOO65_03195 [Methanosarcinales archaeon]|nr:MAG: hypothetical protein EOO65_03195 [Methanosarcinales archaeon]
MDKACESVFGYISVLPGAFSMYRWVAIRGEPLCAYFTIEEIPLSELGAATSNMYLAEDRYVRRRFASVCTSRTHVSARVRASMRPNFLPPHCTHTCVRAVFCALRFWQNDTASGCCATSLARWPKRMRPPRW